MKNLSWGKWWHRICLISGKKVSLLPNLLCRTKVLHPRNLQLFCHSTWLLIFAILVQLCCYTPTGKVSKTDFALYRDSNDMLGCGEVWLHCEVDGKLWTLLSVWKLESYSSNTCSAIWAKTESTMLLDSQQILCPLTWQKHGHQKIVTLVQMPYRP